MKPLGEYLVDDRVITREQVQDALQRQHELYGKGQRKRIGEVLVEMGIVTEEQLQRALDRQQLERT